MAAPVGQDPSKFRQEKKSKIAIRFEFAADTNVKVRKDVHQGNIINPQIKDEINRSDPQIRDIVKEFQRDCVPQTNDNADAWMDKYSQKTKEGFTPATADLMESHAIEALMGALQKEEDYMVLEKVCVQFRIQDVSEYNLERLSQAYLEDDQITVMHVNNQTYQLFGKDQYLISKMNPYQLAIIFNNLKGLRYMTIRLNQHLRLCINGPEINYGGL